MDPIAPVIQVEPIIAACPHCHKLLEPTTSKVPYQVYVQEIAKQGLVSPPDIPPPDGATWGCTKNDGNPEHRVCIPSVGDNSGGLEEGPPIPEVAKKDLMPEMPIGGSRVVEEDRHRVYASLLLLEKLVADLEHYLPILGGLAHSKGEIIHRLAYKRILATMTRIERSNT